MDRLSVQPLLLAAAVTLYLIADDWIWFAKLRRRQIDEFYNRDVA